MPRKIEGGIPFDPKTGTAMIPDDPNANVHGLVKLVRLGNEKFQTETTCLTPTGDLCTGCCYSSSRDFLGEKCPQQMPGAGCEFELVGTRDRKPRECISYHCSKDKETLENDKLPSGTRLASWVRLSVANDTSFHYEEISPQTYKNNKRRLSKPPVVINKSNVTELKKKHKDIEFQLTRLATIQLRLQDTSDEETE